MIWGEIFETILIDFTPFFFQVRSSEKICLIFEIEERFHVLNIDPFFESSNIRFGIK